jgi:hypothetical protein
MRCSGEAQRVQVESMAQADAPLVGEILCRLPVDLEIRKLIDQMVKESDLNMFMVEYPILDVEHVSAAEGLRDTLSGDELRIPIRLCGL